MPRDTRQLPPLAPATLRPLRTEMPRNGNGHAPERPDRLAHIEALLTSIEQQLQVQFQRIADLQVQFDRSKGDRRKSLRP